MFDIWHIPTRQVVRHSIGHEEAVAYLEEHGEEYSALPSW
jgi:hypothetical protein